MQNDRDIENGMVLCDPSYDDPIFIGKCLQCETSKLYADDEIFEDIDGNRICQKCFYKNQDNIELGLKHLEKSVDNFEIEFYGKITTRKGDV